MGTPVTASQITSFLKQYYTGKQVDELIFGSRNRALMNMLTDRQTGGTNDPQVIYRENAQGVAANFLVAQTNANDPKSSQFQVTPPAEGLHGVLQVSTDAMLRSGDDRGAFLKSQAWRFNDVVNALSNFVEVCLLGDGTGVIGQVANTSYSTTVMTLTDVQDAVLFCEGMRCVFANTSIGALLDGGKNLLVNGVNYETGQIIFNANLSTVSGLATNTYVFREGCASNGGAAGSVVPHGLASWIPSTAPTTGDSFYGVDRSVNPQKLAGVRSTGSLGDIYAAVNDHFATQLSYGAELRDPKALTSHANVGRLSKQAQVQVTQQPGKVGKIGFSKVELMTAAGTTEVYGSPFIRSNRLYTFDPADIEIIRLGGSLVYIWDLDGSKLQRLTNSSGVEIRCESRPALKVKRPRDTGVITLS